MHINAMLLIDFYKSVHAEMLPEKITKSVSYFTPRDSRVKRWDKVVNFGLQGFIREYLIDYFNENFFTRPQEEVVAEYRHVMDNGLGKDAYNLNKIINLHRLGYLPIEIVALPEGAMVPLHVPIFGITNTHPNFAWLPQSLESLISAEMWHPMVAATVAHDYRKVVNKYYFATCDDDVPCARALGNFDFRGDHGVNSAIKTAAAWCTSFLNTATVPVIPYLEYMYGCNCAQEPVAYGAPSTEHAVMCSNYAVDGDEVTLLRRLLRDIYPHTSFSAVLDSYDYWNIIDNILPQIHDDIMAHDGCMLMRGDSGNSVDVVTQTVFKLWDQFGGTVNSKGYRVLDSHVKAIYGDSITIQKVEKIYQILMDHGFAACNVSLGVGSFSMNCIQQEREDGSTELLPFTRDTFGMAIKATYCEIDGVPTPIFKNPKESSFKKSHKGCCFVGKDEKTGEYFCEDNYDWASAHKFPQKVNGVLRHNKLKPIFRDGKFINGETSLEAVRNRLNNGEF